MASDENDLEDEDRCIREGYGLSIILRRKDIYSEFTREISRGLFVKNQLTKG